MMGTPDNLALRKGMDRLNIRNVNHVGLLGDVDAGVTHDGLATTFFLPVASERISEWTREQVPEETLR